MMNERIRKLAEQAGFNHMGIGLVIGIEEYHQKFAELIVQECISKLDEEIYRSIDGDGDEAWHDLILKEHFGVEE
jgi:hypothetical protein